MHNQNVQLQNHLRSEMDLMIAQHYLVNVVEGGSECVHGWGASTSFACVWEGAGFACVWEEAQGWGSREGGGGWMQGDGGGGGLGCLPSRMAVLIS